MKDKRYDLGNEKHEASCWRWTLKRVIGVLVVMLLCNPITIILFWPPWISDISDAIVLQRFSHPFFAYPLPDDTIEVGRETFITQGGTGSCFFHATRIFESSLSLEEIEAYFRPLHFPMPFSERMISDFLSSDNLLHPRIGEDDGEFIVSLIAGGPYEYSDILSTGCR